MGGVGQTSRKLQLKTTTLLLVSGKLTSGDPSGKPLLIEAICEEEQSKVVFNPSGFKIVRVFEEGWLQLVEPTILTASRNIDSITART